MFGVGFYSVFYLVDEPIVLSGGKAMLFEWKKANGVNQHLIYHHKDDPDHTSRKDKTVFVFRPIKDKAKHIHVRSLTSFARSCLLFTKTLRKIEIFNESGTLLQVRKLLGSPSKIKIPRRVDNLDLFEITSIHSRICKISTDDSHVNAHTLVSASLRHIMQRDAESESFREGCREVLRKSLPTKTKVELLFLHHSKLEHKAKSGKIFVGMSTAEDTGCDFHLSAHLYPTMERSDVDFVSRHLSRWNKSLVRASGHVARAYYDSIMLSKRGLETNKQLGSFLRRFSFSSTRSPDVAKELQDGFFQKPGVSIAIGGSLCKCGKRMKIPSGDGIEALLRVLDPEGRLNEATSKTVIPAEVFKSSPGFFKALEERKLVSRLDINDIDEHLQQHILTGKKVAEALAWLVNKSLPSKKKDLLLKRMRMRDSAGQIIYLSKIRYFPDAYSLNLPTPPSVLPASVTHHLSKLTSLFKLEKLGLKPLQFSFWAKTLNDPCSEAPWLQINNSNAAAALHSYVSRNRTAPARASLRRAVMDRLRDSKCMPVMSGALIKPSKAYIPPSRDRVEDLPYIAIRVEGRGAEHFLKQHSGASKTISLLTDEEDDMEIEHHHDEKLSPTVTVEYLMDLGVQCHPPMAQLLDSMFEKGTTSRQIVRYFTTGAPLKYEDYEALKGIRFLSCRGYPNAEKFCPRDVYLESDHIVELGKALGKSISILSWKPTREEALFLDRLGVCSHPRMADLFCALAKIARQTCPQQFGKIAEHPLIRFFLEKFEELYEDDYAVPGRKTTVKTERKSRPKSINRNKIKEIKPVDFAYLPSTDNKLCKWEEISLEQSPFLCTLHPAFRRRVESAGLLDALQLKSAPTADDVFERLTCERSRVLTLCNRDEILAYLGKRMNSEDDLKSVHYRQLSKTPFIPIRGSKGTIYVKPMDIFLDAGSMEINASHVGSSDLRGWVHLLQMTGEAADFLTACRVKSEPTPADVALSILDPRKRALQIDEKGVPRNVKGYRKLLEILASGYGRLRKDIKEKLKSAEVLLARQGISKSSYILVRAAECYLVDNSLYASLINPMCAPMDFSEDVQNLYKALGAEWLTNACKMRCRPQHVLPYKADRAVNLETTIRDRARLLVRSKDGNKISGLKPGAERVLSSLKVEEARKFERVLEFCGRRIPLETKKNADIGMCSLDETTKTLYLLHKQSLNLFDVGNELAKISVSSAKAEQMGNNVARVLSFTTGQLAARGWPVRRFCSGPEEEVKHMNRVSSEMAVVKEGKEEVKFDVSEIGHILKGCRRCKALRLDASRPVVVSHREEIPAILSSGLKLTKIRVDGIPVFVSNDQHAEEDSLALAENGADRLAVQDFCDILISLAHVCRVSVKVIHVFVDRYTQAIAFNQGGSLFFNFRSFSQHCRGRDRRKLITEWFVTMCHEIAHNVSSNHDKAHSHAMETIIHNLIPNLVDCSIYRAASTPLRLVTSPSVSECKDDKAQDGVSTRRLRKRRKATESRESGESSRSSDINAIGDRKSRKKHKSDVRKQAAGRSTRIATRRSTRTSTRTTKVTIDLTQE
ncbi:hypothetical protein AAMO2058_000280600 [Amorphochlora amoebiformis]